MSPGRETGQGFPFAQEITLGTNLAEVVLGTSAAQVKDRLLEASFCKPVIWLSGQVLLDCGQG